MEQLFIDSGIKEYQINGKGVLRFNPSDPNVYARFLELVPKIESIEKACFIITIIAIIISFILLYKPM